MFNNNNNSNNDDDDDGSTTIDFGADDNNSLIAGGGGGRNDNRNPNDNTNNPVGTGPLRNPTIIIDNTTLRLDDPSTANLMAWRERERRQRTFRVLLMFLLMLLLMEEEEPNNRYPNNNGLNNNHPRNNHLRHSSHPGPHPVRASSSFQQQQQQQAHSHLRRNQQQQQQQLLPKKPGGRNGNSKHLIPPLSLEVWRARQNQDQALQTLTRRHPRYAQLVEKNYHRPIDQAIDQWLHDIVRAAREKRRLELQNNSSSTMGGETTAGTTFVNNKTFAILDNDNAPIVARPSDLEWWLEQKQQQQTGKDGGGEQQQQQQQQHSKEEEQEQNDDKDDNAKKTIWHYPWNSTGFYRGHWTVLERNSQNQTSSDDKKGTTTTDTATTTTTRDNSTVSTDSESNQKSSSNRSINYVDPTEVEEAMLQQLRRHAAQWQEHLQTFLTMQKNKEQQQKNNNNGKEAHETAAAAALLTNNPFVAGIQRIPNHNAVLVDNATTTTKSSPSSFIALKVRNDHNLTHLQWDQMTVDANGEDMYTPDGALRTPDTDQMALERALRLENGTETSNDTATSLQPPSPPSLFWSSSNTLRKNGNDNDDDDDKMANNKNKKKQLPLSKTHGRAAFQLYSRTVPGMKELSLVDGFVKLYDSTSPGYSTRNDVLLRVRGVLIHAIGHLSLLSSNVDVTQHALVVERVPPSEDGESLSSSSSSSPFSSSAVDANGMPLMEERPPVQPVPAGRDAVGHRRLVEEQNGNDSLPSSNIDHQRKSLRDKLERITQQSSPEEFRQIHEELQQLDQHYTQRNQEQEKAFGESDGGRDYGWKPLLTSMPDDPKSLQEQVALHRKLESALAEEAVEAKENESEREGSRDHDTERADGKEEEKPDLPLWSDVVIPYPYVRDDDEETIRMNLTPGARRMPSREQALEANALGCAFEIALNVQETEWNLDDWRKLLRHKWNEHKRLDPENPINAPEEPGDDTNSTTASLSLENGKSAAKAKSILASSSSHSTTTPYRKRKKVLPDQALVMNMVGTIHSDECNFEALVNVTALRTDWDATTSKAINYSFYMMLVCLVQIILLLRQLLHSQTQSAATRVSMLCIGWQTVLDALICLGHIYLCLAMQPLFTAFASVSFFKLLIFCVIEMKYMAIIIQARASASGGQPTDVLRRQVAVLHLRFYLSLLATFMFLFYVGEKYRTVYMLVLYSFWVPQIVLNVITEAKTPMHKYYIYGMSATRLVVPLYLYGVQKNFLKEVYPEAPYDPWTCQCLFVWVGLQTALLIGQSKYGARFFIPDRFLPPKYDYSRPIPSSILNNTTRNTTTTEFVDTTAPKATNHHATSVTTRNRMRGNRGAQNNSQHGRTTSSSNATNESLSPSSSSSTSPITTAATTTETTTTETTTEASILICSICHERIDVMRQSYMLTPCDHLFHKDCLLQWMDIKMECPTCRTDLPPV